VSQERSIHPDTTLGPVRLTVGDLDRAQQFYGSSIGLESLVRSKDTAVLGTNGTPLLELVGRPDSLPRPPGTTGLFHLAIVLPSRIDLARALKRFAETGVPLTGASDHLVSEALYLRDPEGNGIEVYRDRPREEWRYSGGALEMDTLPLDIEGVLGELAGPGDEADVLPAGTRIGHVHLQVADLGAAEEFYNGALGFDVTVRGYPGALFLSAGGYHHHVGLNTWASAGAPPPPSGARGLAWFQVVLPDGEELERVAGRIDAAGLDMERQDGGLVVADPSGNRVLLRSA
jgi:catechol 2,3-dioxygenase